MPTDLPAQGVAHSEPPISSQPAFEISGSGLQTGSSCHSKRL